MFDYSITSEIKWHNDYVVLLYHTSMASPRTLQSFTGPVYTVPVQFTVLCPAMYCTAKSHTGTVFKVL